MALRRESKSNAVVLGGFAIYTVGNALQIVGLALAPQSVISGAVP